MFGFQGINSMLLGANHGKLLAPEHDSMLILQVPMMLR
jgi:hypothetical protein